VGETRERKSLEAAIEETRAKKCKKTAVGFYHGPWARPRVARGLHCLSQCKEGMVNAGQLTRNKLG